MDAAYDHIAEKTWSGDRAATPTPRSDQTSSSQPSEAPTSPKRESLQTEFQETFKAFSASPWGARLGGLWGNVQKQSQTYIEVARKEAEAAKGDALKGFTDLKQTLEQKTRSLSLGEQEAKDQPATSTASNEATKVTQIDADTAISENESFIARFRAEAAKRLKDIEKAEDAADEALLRFGTNVRNFLKDAVTVLPAEEENSKQEKTTVLFDSSNPSAGTTQTSQERRKELLKATSNTEEVSWDDDSDDDENSRPSTPNQSTTKACQPPTTPRAKQTQSSTPGEATLPLLESQHTGTTLRPEQPRRSHDEKSVADSDASYDVVSVSGANSRAPGSPKDKRSPRSAGGAGDSDEEDWE